MKLRVVEQLVPRDNGRPAADITPASLRRKFAVVHCRYFAGTLIVNRWNIVTRVERGQERVSRPLPGSIALWITLWSGSKRAFFFSLLSFDFRTFRVSFCSQFFNSLLVSIFEFFFLDWAVLSIREWRAKFTIGEKLRIKLLSILIIYLFKTWE